MNFTVLHLIFFLSQLEPISFLYKLNRYVDFLSLLAEERESDKFFQIISVMLLQESSCSLKLYEQKAVIGSVRPHKEVPFRTMVLNLGVTKAFDAKNKNSAK